MTAAKITDTRPTKPFLSKLKGFVSANNQWEGFVEVLDYEIEMQRKKLEQSVDPIEIYQAQGAIHALRQLKYLRDQVNAK
jgi:hypothetical protein